MRTRIPAWAPLCLLALTLSSAPTDGQSWRRFRTDTDEPIAPCLVPWQRNLADAEALSQRTGRPLLICVNMDGEPASEVFARRKYTSPRFAELAAPFVPIIVSPNRHGTADYDERGVRIPCPRFGRVTCGEHVSIEPIVYEKYFAGRRVAPRHVGVSAGGALLFDHFLLQDLGVVDDALLAHGSKVEAKSLKAGTITDAEERERREREYLEGARAARSKLLRLTRKDESPHYDLIRLGLFDEDVEVRRLAQNVLADVADASGVDLVLDVLTRGSETSSRAPLLRTLKRLSKDDERARNALLAHEGIEERSKVVDIAAWSKALARGAEAAPEVLAPDWNSLIGRLEELESIPGVDPVRDIELARINLIAAQHEIDNGRNPSFFLLDADRSAEAAVSHGAEEPTALAIRSEAAYLLNQTERAGELAERALPELVERAAERVSASALEVLARTRTASIYRASQAKEEWPALWLSDAHAAYRVLAQHPRGTEELAIAHSDLLSYLRLEEPNGEHLRSALRRHPVSAELHTRYRDHVWRVRGPHMLEAAYADLGTSQDPAADAWFHGYASLVAAEHYKRRDRREEADAAYDRAVAHFEESVQVRRDYTDSADHYVVLALAGRARIAHETGQSDEATDKILAAILRRPQSAEWPDGLKRTPLHTLRLIRRDLEQRQREDLLARLSRELQPVVPKLWERTGATRSKTGG